MTEIVLTAVQGATIARMTRKLLYDFDVLVIERKSDPEYFKDIIIKMSDEMVITTYANSDKIESDYISQNELKSSQPDTFSSFPDAFRPFTSLYQPIAPMVPEPMPVPLACDPALFVTTLPQATPAPTEAPAPKAERIKRTAAEIAAGIPLADVPECRASGLSPDAFKARKYAAPVVTPEPTKTLSPVNELDAMAQELGMGYDPEPEPDVSSQPWAGILYGNDGLAQNDDVSDVSEAEVIF